MTLSITWLGHATFLLRSPGGKTILIDPWVTGNPSSPESAKNLGALDLMLLTHGHGDHTGDAVSIGRSSGAHIIAPYELSVWLESKGLQKVTGMNPGGTLRTSGLAITMVQAMHSSSIDEDGPPSVHRSGDGVCHRVRGRPDDLLRRRHVGLRRHAADRRDLQTADRLSPDRRSVHDGSGGAAKACELLGVKQVVPMHYGTFPALTGTPARLRELVEPRGVQVLELKPGETTR